MVHELADEGDPGRVVRVVRVVGAQGEVDDQVLGAAREVVVRIEQAAGLADLEERGLERGARLGERGQPEDAPEAVGALDHRRRRVPATVVPLAGDSRAQASLARSHRARRRSGQELAAGDPSVSFRGCAHAANVRPRSRVGNYGNPETFRASWPRPRVR